MKKLKLNLNDLKIESFKISNTQKKQGTVKGELPFTERPNTNCQHDPCDTTDGIACSPTDDPPVCSPTRPPVCIY